MTPHRATAASSAAAIGPEVGLVVHSHLRWDFVWQRPQQLLSRVAATNPVLFVEEPITLDDITEPVLKLSTPFPGVTRAIPQLPASLAYSYDDAIVIVRSLVSALLASSPFAEEFQRVVQWFYTPMPACAMLGAFDEIAVVYDCMDELAQFRFAPSDIGARERQLLSQADVVFTGGYRLFESKSRFHDNVHFFGCGVDAQHFGKARLPSTQIPDDARHLGRPVFGYFGVIDERLDYELIRALAEARPDATVLMIGPFAKVDPRDLPQASNITWLGQRNYVDLPNYVKAFDVCLMPFALNDATEYINPTKTLEYMAAGKPIVSTAVADVVRNFTPIVRIARSPEDFVAAVSGAAVDTDDTLRAAGIKRAANASWESIVERMREIIGEAVSTSATEPAAQTSGVLDGASTSRQAAWRARGRTATSLDLASGAGGAVP